MEWMKQSIDVNPPSSKDIIQTKEGALIIDKSFRNTVYLKDLKFERSPDDEEFNYGYNFARGKINREQKSLASAKQQAFIVTSIWAQVIKVKGAAFLAPCFDMF